MQEYEELISELIDLGISSNPVCPFTCCILDSSGQILVTAANAMHISPLFSAEGLALHMLAGHYRCRLEQELTLVTTAEPECGAISAMSWGQFSGINVARIVYGASREKLDKLWECDFSPGAREMVDRLPDKIVKKPELSGPVLEDDCMEAFDEGKKLYDAAEMPVLSMDLEDYWMAGDWLLEE
ncbi:MAG: hypothetical protein ACR2PT_05475 [Endozoicomonas sp.]